MARKKKSLPTPVRPPVGAGSARIEAAVREQQRRVAHAIAGLEAASVDDVHAARVAARRLRSLIKTFGALLETRRARLYRADLRSFARTLGPTREADVRRELLLGLARRDAGIPTEERRRLETRLDDACVAARDELRAHTAEPQWAALCAALERQRAGDELFLVRDAVLPEVMSRVNRTWRKPVRLLKKGPSSSFELHELRLAFKHCRYALEPVADVMPEATARLLRRLRATQDLLGEHRDVLLAAGWIREHAQALGRPLMPRLARALDRREKQLLRQSATRATRVLEAWRAWRDATRRVRKGRKAGRS